MPSAPRSLFALGWLGLLATSTCALPAKEVACDNELVELFGDGCDVCGAQCCAEADACAADPGCAERVQCALACIRDRGNAADCHQDCALAAENPTRPDAALLHCLGDRCEADGACSLAERESFCPGVELTSLFGSTACGLCVAQHACNELSTCQADPRCRQRLECMDACTGPNLDPACHDACRDDFGSDLSALPGELESPVLVLANKECRDACGFGQAWSCVGDYGWPPPTEDEVTVYLRAIRFGNAEPWVGLEVKPCNQSLAPGACEGDIPIATTDDQGIAELTLPTQFAGMSPGFRGVLQVSGDIPDEMGVDDFPDWILFRDRPEFRDRGVDGQAPFGARSNVNLILDPLQTKLGIVFDEANLGVISGTVLDCRGLFFDFNTSVEGATVDIEPAAKSTTSPNETAIVYLRPLPDTDLTATAQTGQFAIVNVVPGVWRVTVTNAAGDVVAEPRVLVEAGKFTATSIYPEDEE